MDLLRFRVTVLTWCYLFDARETSGIRSRSHNEQLKGVEHSAHLVGLASDVIYQKHVPEEERRQWANRLGLYLHVEADHDHLQPLDWEAG